MFNKTEDQYKNYLYRVFLVFLLSIVFVVAVFLFLQYALNLNATVKELGFDSPELQDNNKNTSN